MGGNGEEEEPTVRATISGRQDTGTRRSIYVRSVSGVSPLCFFIAILSSARSSSSLGSGRTKLRSTRTRARINRYRFCPRTRVYTRRLLLISAPANENRSRSAVCIIRGARVCSLSAVRLSGYSLEELRAKFIFVYIEGGLLFGMGRFENDAKFRGWYYSLYHL